MQYIKLVAISDGIQSPRLAELFESKLSYLSDSLDYLNMVGIDAAITITGSEKYDQLETHVRVECTDEGFKKVIEGVVSLFNHSVYELTELISSKYSAA